MSIIDECTRLGRTFPCWEQLYARELTVQFRKTPPELVKNVDQFPPWLWDKLRHNGVRVKDLVVGHLPNDSRPARRAREWEWGLFKYSCPNWFPWYIYITERQYSGLFERTRQRRPSGSPLFDDLSRDVRADAEQLFDQFCEHWVGREGFEAVPTIPQPDWRKPLLAGAARRLARDPSNRSPEWGRQMLRIKVGKHVQQRYREQGWHPLASVRKAWGLTSDRPQTALSLRARLQAMTERANQSGK